MIEKEVEEDEKRKKRIRIAQEKSFQEKNDTGLEDSNNVNAMTNQRTRRKQPAHISRNH